MLDAEPTLKNEGISARESASLRAGNVHTFRRSADPEDDNAATRQDIVHSLHEALSGAVSGLRNIPIFVREAIEAKVWQQERIFAGGTRQKPVSFHAFVHEPYPVGLGADYAVVRRFLIEDAATLSLWDQAVQQPAGAPAGNQNAAAAKQTTVDNIHDRQRRPTGTSAQAGLRRLRLAVEAGDERAAPLLARVTSGETSINAAAIAMGWRKPTVTLVDEPGAIFAALVARVGVPGILELIADATQRSAIGRKPVEAPSETPPTPDTPDPDTPDTAHSAQLYQASLSRTHAG